MAWYEKTALGQVTNYQNDYNPALLCPLARAEGRQQLGLVNEQLPFHGVDIWHNYEASWLNAKGKPEVAIIQLLFPATSPYLIESKSLKLYFNALNFKRFNHQDEFVELLISDLSQAAGGTVVVNVIAVEQAAQTHQLSGTCLDEQDIAFDDFVLDACLLTRSTETGIMTESVYSHLLRSNCPVTNQPDWGSIQISYTGQAIDHESLLRYLVSFRQHNDFHEQCVERVFSDIMRQCQPEKLTVQAYYSRRGGLDINPFRSNTEQPEPLVRLIRQ